MTATQDDMVPELLSANAVLRQERDAAVAREVVIAAENVRLLGELRQRTQDLDEALEYQRAVSDVQKVISRSAFELQPVLDALVGTSARLCNADQAVLARSDGRLAWLASNVGFPTEYETYVRSLGNFPVDEHSPLVAFRALCERNVVHIHDVAAVPNYPDHPIRLGKQRTSLGVPLLREGESIGVIVLARQRVEPFTDRQIALLRTFADQAVNAIENTRLLAEQREALEQQTAMAEVLGVINSSPGNLVPVFDAILAKAHALCGAPLGSLVLCDGEQLRAAATRGYPQEYEAWARRGFSLIPPFRLLLSGEPFVHVHDTAAWPAAPDEEDPMRRAAVGIAGVRTALFVPLRKDAAVLGYISAQRQEVRPFTDSQIALLRNFAAQAVIAMENARLLTEQREALEQQTAMAEVLGIINASPGNLDPVFEAILQRAMYLCQAAFGGFWMLVGDRYVATALHGVPDAYAEFVTRNTQLPGPGSAPYRFLYGERSVLQNIDLADDELYRTGNVQRRALVDIGGARTALHVPQGGPSIHRQAGSTATELRWTGGDCDGKCPVARPVASAHRGTRATPVRITHHV